MDIEAVKEYLNQIRELDRLIDSKQERLSELYAMISSPKAIRYDADRVQTSLPGDQMAAVVAKIIDIQNEINTDIDRFVDLEEEIMQIVRKLKNPEEIALVKMKYFEYKSIRQIARETYRSKRTVQRIHKRALKKLSPLIPPPK